MAKDAVCPWCNGVLIKRRFTKERRMGRQWIWAMYCPPCRRRMGASA